MIVLFRAIWQLEVISHTRPHTGTASAVSVLYCRVYMYIVMFSTFR